EEVRATGLDRRPEIVAPLVGGKDLVKARLAINLELARRRLRIADRKAAEAKRLVEVQAGAPGEMLEITGDVEEARAEHEALEALLRIRRAFVAGEMPEAAAELQAAVAEVTAELKQARVQNQVASARVRELRALFDVGRVTKAELREALIEAVRTRTEHEIVRLELERLKREGAPRGSTELVYRIKAGGDERARVLDVIDKRLAGYGFDDVALGPVAEDRFSVRVSAPSRERLDRIKALVMALGKLEFRITVEPGASGHHAHYWRLFEETRKKGAHEDVASFISPDDVPRNERARFPDGLRWYRLADEDRFPKARWARDGKGASRPWVLCELDGHNVTGEHLYDVVPVRDPSGLGTGWAVHFKVKKPAHQAMSRLTSFAEDKYMAIIVNGKVHAAPLLRSTLSDAGQITGDYTEEAARMLAAILQAGSLKHEPELVSERTITADEK
ncbi:MAG: SecDF P1 head subdomain-containing protein, partial [Planctomycetota bacterium]